MCEAKAGVFNRTSSRFSLKKVEKKCNELDSNTFYQNNYRTEKIIHLKNGGVIIQSMKWFNGVDVGKNSTTNVLGFEEIEINLKGEIVRYFTTEWLSSQKITKNNCLTLAIRARMRADHEDLHNSLKNRGFNAKHDYARANANGWLIWKSLMFIAFWIFEVFSLPPLLKSLKVKALGEILPESFLVIL